MIVISVPCGSYADELQDQQKAVRGFYSTTLRFKEPGIPSKENIGKLAPYISRELRDLLLKALDAEDVYAKKTGNEVPPLVESFLFYSEFEGASSLGAVRPEAGGKRGAFIVELTHVDPNGKEDAFTWKDRAIVLRENNRWVVDNIEYLGTWEFGDKGSVKDVLRNAIKDAEEAKPE